MSSRVAAVPVNGLANEQDKSDNWRNGDVQGIILHITVKRRAVEMMGVYRVLLFSFSFVMTVDVVDNNRKAVTLVTSIAPLHTVAECRWLWHAMRLQRFVSNEHPEQA
jgi:hypothetical protein